MVRFFVPGKEFPAVSVTGSQCALGCLHCEGHFLKGMTPVQNPSHLWEFATNLERNGGTGFLLSGGCDAKGRVPMSEYGKVLRRIKRETDLLVNVHPGIVGAEEVEMLSSCEVDSVSVDVIGSTRTLRDIYRMDRTVSSIETSLRLLSEASVPLTPHVCVGVHGGYLIGETRALDIASEANPSALVITALLPVKGLAFESVRTDPNLTVDFYRQARKKLPNVPIVLGCLRPRDPGTEDTLLKEGLDGIAVPHPRTLKNGGEVERTCCSLIGSRNR